MVPGVNNIGLIDILLLDLKSFFRDIRSSTLLILTPLIIVLIVGMSFLGTTPSNIKIGLCMPVSGQINDYISNSLSKSSGFEVINTGSGTKDFCEQAIRAKMLDSTLTAGVVVFQDPDGIRSTVEVVVDNSKLVSEYIKWYMSVVTNDVSDRLTKGYVDVIFQNVDTARNSISTVSDIAKREKISLLKIRNSVISVRNDINSARSKTRGSAYTTNYAINGVSSSINDIGQAVNSLQYVISSIDSTIAIADSMNATAIKSNLLASRDQISDSINRLRGVNSSLDVHRKNLITVESDLKGTDTIFDSVIKSLDDVIVTIDSSINDADFLITRIDSINSLVSNKTIEKPEDIRLVETKMVDLFPQSKFVDFLFPSIVIMVIMTITTFLSSVTLIRQRSSGLLQRISLTSGGIGVILISRLFLMTVLNLLILPLILAVGILGLGINFPIVITIPLIFCTILTALTFASIGLMIASLSKYESTAILLAIVITLPMIFLSGILTPLENLPPYLYTITYGLPLNISTQLLRGLIFYNVEPFISTTYVLILLMYFVAFTVAASILIRRDIKR